MAQNTSTIRVDTAALRGYANRLVAVNNRIHKLDARVKALLAETGMQGLQDIIKDNTLLDSAGRVDSYTRYLRETASCFEVAEKAVLSQW